MILSIQTGQLLRIIVQSKKTSDRSILSTDHAKLGTHIGSSWQQSSNSCGIKIDSLADYTSQCCALMACLADCAKGSHRGGGAFAWKKVLNHPYSCVPISSIAIDRAREPSMHQSGQMIYLSPMWLRWHNCYRLARDEHSAWSLSLHSVTSSSPLQAAAWYFISASSATDVSSINATDH